MKDIISESSDSSKNNDFTSFYKETGSNSSLTGVIVNSASLIYEDLIQLFCDYQEEFYHSFGGTTLQREVFLAFVIILTFNLLLICFLWQKFSQIITETLATNQAWLVEDSLKKKSAFKLPKEHTPRN